MPKHVLDIKGLRKSSGLNQQQFWGAIGVTQSGGSRYEHERSMPAPVETLLRLRYVLGIDINLIDEAAANVIRHILDGDADSQALIAKAKHARSLSQTLSELATQASHLAQA